MKTPRHARTAFIALGDYSPISCATAAAELATRTPSPAEVTTLITLAEGSDANSRMGACETLGILKNTSALPALGRRLRPVPCRCPMPSSRRRRTVS